MAGYKNEALVSSAEGTKKRNVAPKLSNTRKIRNKKRTISSQSKGLAYPQENDQIGII